MIWLLSLSMWPANDWINAYSATIMKCISKIFHCWFGCLVYQCLYLELHWLCFLWRFYTHSAYRLIQMWLGQSVWGNLPPKERLKTELNLTKYEYHLSLFRQKRNVKKTKLLFEVWNSHLTAAVNWTKKWDSSSSM